MELQRLIEGLGIRHAAGPRDVRVCDVTDDSRTVVPGSLFVARSGYRVDGRGFIAEAVRAGAVAVLSEAPVDSAEGGHAAILTAEDVPLAMARLGERFYGGPSSQLVLVGVTGTNGKTTCAHMIHQLLNGVGVRAGLIGTVLVDDGAEVAPAAMTTPPAFEISRSLALMVESGCRAAVVEASSHALVQRRVAGVAFDAAVFTNLSGDHLDYHGSMEAYADAKAMLFEMLGEDAVAIVNADDAASGRMLRGCPARVVRCSADASREGAAEARAELLTVSLDEMRLRLSLPERSAFDAGVRMTGAHNACNALLATAAALAAFDRVRPGSRPAEAEIAEQLARLRPPPGRLEPVHGEEDDVRVFVDFAHTDDALEKALTAVGDAMGRDGRAAGAQLWVVFGCGGNKDRTKRPRMGAVAARLARRLVVTSDNPRTENPNAIIGEILAGLTPEQRQAAAVHADRRTAIRHAISNAAPRDVIVIAGKGHEREQEVAAGSGGTRRIRFDDREEARGALIERRARRARFRTREGAPA